MTNIIKGHSRQLENNFTKLLKDERKIINDIEEKNHFHVKLIKLSPCQSNTHAISNICKWFIR